MSGKGRGGGSSNTMRSVANALGIARYDMAKMLSQQKVEPPELYPKVQRNPVSLEMTTDMLYVSRLKVELDQRMRDSQFFIEAENGDELKRYVDKFSTIKREKLEIDMSQMPSELVWRRATKSLKDPAAKRRKIMKEDPSVTEKLEKLAEKEGQNNEDEEEEKPDEDNETGSEKSAGEEEENPLSDDDNQEEDNDYISNYFDNGEGYGDGGSDDNMDGDEF
ncbi:unnamed protein product [Caenorhabditis sp. 36 PRJEB53466]|nr:unnamed protein product [Caenorhabditis sp. 36 PRJEB53466]